MKFWFLLLAISASPRGYIVVDSFDVVELNHHYDENGKPVFDQYIGWNLVNGRLRCEFWRFSKHFSDPIRDHVRGGWKMFGCEVTEGMAPRLVRFRVFDETWTQYCPELEDRNNFPQSKRKGLCLRKTAMKSMVTTD